MTITIPESPQVVSCQSTPDFLAALPQFIGFSTPNSLVAVRFTGGRSAQAIRMDLPVDLPSPKVGEFIDTLIAALDSLDPGDGTPRSAAIAVITDHTFAGSDGIPWRQLARRIDRRLPRAGWGLRELCCQAPDGWGSYTDPGSPRYGSPLSDIASSPIALEEAFQGAQIPSLADLGAIPDPDPERAAQIAAIFDKSEPVAVESGDWIKEVTRVSRDLRGFASARGSDTSLASLAPLAPSRTVRLAQTLQRSDRWFVVALGVLTRPEYPEELAEELGRQHFTEIPVGPHSDGSLNARPNWSISQLLLTLCAGFEDHSRLPLVQDRLRTAISECPVPQRTGLFTLSAWVWWLDGKQSVAQQHLDAALAIAPDDELASMLNILIAAPAHATAFVSREA